jgi:ABC-type polysaccharide/polyol phosphate transport system ATPase subunit
VKDSRILFDRVWKKFHRGQLHDSLRDLISAGARRLAGRGTDAKELDAGDFWAVRDLSFEVRPGQTLGIIGPNGSGKSTTLKMLTRILAPTRGYSEVRGRLGALIEVSAGFHGDLTGRENVFLQGAIMGMRTTDILRKFDEIVEFSGVEESIDTPVKRYSSGMNARLGFSIAAHLEPDVLIIDEVLSVGDLSFQRRAFGRIRDLATSGIPVVIVSHQLDRIAELCTDAILLDRGGVMARGTAADAIGAYIKLNDSARTDAGSGLVVFEGLRVLGDGVVGSGHRFAIQIDGRVTQPLPPGADAIHVRVRSLHTGALLFATGARRLGLNLEEPKPFSVRLELQANLSIGNYTIEVAAQDLKSQTDLVAASSVGFRVVDTETFFQGAIQLNALMSAIE